MFRPSLSSEKPMHTEVGSAHTPSESKPAPTRAVLWIIVECVAWTVGVLGIAVWAGMNLAGSMGARQDLERFAARRALAAVDARVDDGRPDQSLWSPERVRAWHETLSREAPEPLGVLRIPRIGLEVAILPGTDEWTLNRAVGHIANTPPPGTDGNSGVAGHRDGFFRGLKDVQAGDSVELETLRGLERYTIERIVIVAPEDVWVLDPTPSRTLTLVTCYPFYHVGPAPRRFIVRAVSTP
jgi:sortase A